MRLSVVMIARDEEHNVRDCFDSFWDHVDEIVLCDTGSLDGTVMVAEQYAAERGDPGKLVVGRFAWCDDFAAARTYAHSLATGSVHARHDLDERVQGAEHLRHVAGLLEQRPGVTAVYAPLVGPGVYAGAGMNRLWRPPVVWENPTWEQVVGGGESHVTDMVRWLHTRTGSHGGRDVDIALKWAASEPENPIPWLVAARERAMRAILWGDDDWRLVMECCDECLSRLRGDMREYRAEMLAYKAHATFRLGDWEMAARLARDALRAAPPHDQSACCTALLVLADVACETGAWDDAFRLGQRAADASVDLHGLQLASIVRLRALAGLEEQGAAPPGVTARTVASLEADGLLPAGLGDAGVDSEAFRGRLRDAVLPGSRTGVMADKVTHVKL